MSYYESRNLACMDQLQDVVIEVSDVTNEWEFAKYIRKHAQNLKKMVVLYSSRYADVVMMRKTEMISAATIILQQK